jgi:TolB-like protein
MARTDLSHDPRAAPILAVLERALLEVSMGPLRLGPVRSPHLSAIFFGLMALAALPAGVRAQSVNVAIFPLSGFAIGADGAALASVLRDMLITEFSQNAQLKVVERSAIDELMKSRRLSLSGGAPDAEITKVGQLLGAQYGIAGGLTISGPTARLDLRLIDIETSEIPNTFKDSAPKDEFLTLVEEVSKRFSNMKVKARVAEVVVPVKSIFAYSRGLDYEKRGEAAKAASMYKSALQIFPDNAAARAGLERVNKK